MNCPVHDSIQANLTGEISRRLTCVLLKIFLILMSFLMTHCTEEETTDQLPFILLKQGDEYAQDGAREIWLFGGRGRGGNHQSKGQAYNGR
jgi:hypothetical protein